MINIVSGRGAIGTFVTRASLCSAGRLEYSSFCPLRNRHTLEANSAHCLCIAGSTNSRFFFESGPADEIAVLTKTPTTNCTQFVPQASRAMFHVHSAEIWFAKGPQLREGDRVSTGGF